MKTLKLPVLGFVVLVLVSSCKKDDFKEESIDSITTSTLEVDETDTVGWQSSTLWETADQETFSVQYLTIEDATITADVAENGLVLLYKKAGNSIHALPFEENNGAGEEEAAADDEEGSLSNYWYHQVTEGSLLISRDVYKSTGAPDASDSFKYYVITPEKLQNLQADGHTTEELMNLSYKEVTALLEAVL